MQDSIDLPVVCVALVVVKISYNYKVVTVHLPHRDTTDLYFLVLVSGYLTDDVIKFGSKIAFLIQGFIIRELYVGKNSAYIKEQPYSYARILRYMPL